ncbi:hypothetical protein HX062_09695, partial [Myroides sp. DF42-4-2]|nr:hypothetical protein [Myroides sp. DF42-4-2]
LASTKGEKGDKGDTGADGLSAYDLWAALPENAGKTPTDFLASTKGEKGDKGDTGADGLSAYDLWAALPENTGKTPADFLASTKGDKGDKGDTGSSTFELWKTLAGNEDKTMDDFITEQKADPKTTKLVDNQNNTFTFYNESEVDNAGTPIAGTGVTFPTRKGYSLTNFIDNDVSRVRTPGRFTYNEVIAASVNSEKTIETITFDVFEDINKPKMLSYSFSLYENLILNGTNVTKKTVEIFIYMKIYINDVLIYNTPDYPNFIANLYTYKRRFFTKQLDLTNIPLTPTNNTLKLVINVASIGGSASNNTGTTPGTFATGNAEIAIVSCTDSSLVLYEK